jgi:hypothetical protein
VLRADDNPQEGGELLASRDRSDSLAPVGGILAVGAPGSLVGMDAAMRSRFRPTLEAHHHTNSVGRGASERSIAELWLGAGHPLVDVLRQAETVFAQLVSVTAVQAAGVVFLFANLRFGLSLAIAGVVVQLGLVCRLAALRARRREVCLELIVAGRQRLPVACVAREARRLLNPGTVERLAGSVEEILKVAAQRPPLHPAARPIFYIGDVRGVAPELRQVASLLRGGRPCVRGVAAVEWLLTSSESPLYGVDVGSSRQELGRVRYLLSLTS